MYPGEVNQTQLGLLGKVVTFRDKIRLLEAGEKAEGYATMA